MNDAFQPPNLGTTLNQRLDIDFALQAAGMGVWEFDPKTNIAHWDQRCRELYGLPVQSQISYSQAFEYIHADDATLVKEAVAVALSPESDGLYDVTFRTIGGRDSQLRWVRFLGKAYFDEDGQVHRFAGIAQNVTPQEQDRYQLEQANYSLGRANDNLQTFAYIASHDLQEPLRKIQQFGDLLLDRMADKMEAENLSYLKKMIAASARVSTLLRDLLGFSRISTQRDTNQPVALEIVLRNALEELDMIVERSEAQIKIDPLPIITGDALQLEQLFQNLLGNALKFTIAGTVPQIHVRSRVVPRAQLPNSIKANRNRSDYHCIEVIDNGIGFDEKHLDRIFQAFQRLHSKSAYEGTGIGLAICEKIASNHGGGITASSRPNYGTTFFVYLPLEQ